MCDATAMEEVDDVVKTLMTSTPATGLSCYVASEHSAFTAPNTLLQGTGVPFAGTSVAVAVTSAQVAFRARVTDLLGISPRGAPV